MGCNSQAWPNLAPSSTVGRITALNQAVGGVLRRPISILVPP